MPSRRSWSRPVRSAGKLVSVSTALWGHHVDALLSFGDGRFRKRVLFRFKTLKDSLSRVSQSCVCVCGEESESSSLHPLLFVVVFVCFPVVCLCLRRMEKRFPLSGAFCCCL